MQYFVKELHNGIRILHVPARTITAWCGLYINTGTRDEEKSEGGIAHFFEHVLFKGTERRPAWRIISSIDDSGGELNAYTTKEETFVYASFLRSELKKAVDILTDITFHSTFPEKEVEKERGVILDEIESYKDDPVESLFDKFDALYFKGHPLEKPILGTTASVKKITREQLSGFVKRKYNTDQIIFCSVGNFNFERICKYAEPLLNEVPASIRSFERKPFIYSTPFHTTQKEDIHSAYYLLATTETYRNASGDRIDKTEWHTIILWRGLADLADKYLRKGARIYVEGKLRNRQIEGPDGSKKTITEIEAENLVMLDRRQDSNRGGYGQNENYDENTSYNQNSNSNSSSSSAGPNFEDLGNENEGRGNSPF